MSPVEPHDWHSFDVERLLEVRQLTSADEPNQWEVRNALGRTAVLAEQDFARLRAEPAWMPEELR